MRFFAVTLAALTAVGMADSVAGSSSAAPPSGYPTNAAPSSGAPTNAAPSNAALSSAPLSNAAPSNGAPSSAPLSNAAPSNAAPSDAAPSSAPLSNAAPSNAGPSGAPLSNAAPSNTAPSSAATSSAASSGAASSGAASSGAASSGTASSNSAPSSASSSAPASTSSSSGVPPGQIPITVHPDGQCEKPLADGEKTAIYTENGFPSYNTINGTFAGAEAKDGSGYDVYWNIPQPAAGCRTFLMTPYAQGAGAGAPGLPPGNEIINVGTAGCYFGNVPADGYVMLSFCCGQDDCAAASLNSSLLQTGPVARDVDLTQGSSYPESAELPKERAMPALPIDRPFGKTTEKRGSPAAQAKSMLTKRGNCGSGMASDSFPRAGAQILLSAIETCNEDPCDIATSFSVQVSTTAESSTSTTYSSDTGVSLSVKAGVDFIAQLDVTATVSEDFIYSIEHTTGQSIMHGNTTTITNTVGLELGTRGGIAFTPAYTCWNIAPSCNPNNPYTVCQPNFNNGVLQGELVPLSTN